MERDRKKYAASCRAVRQAVRRMKDSWFLQKAVEAEGRRHCRKVVWRCIRDIQRARRGMVPMKTTVVMDEKANRCTTP